MIDLFPWTCSPTCSLPHHRLRVTATSKDWLIPFFGSTPHRWSAMPARIPQSLRVEQLEQSKLDRYSLASSQGSSLWWVLMSSDHRVRIWCWILLWRRRSCRSPSPAPTSIWNNDTLEERRRRAISIEVVDSLDCSSALHTHHWGANVGKSARGVDGEPPLSLHSSARGLEASSLSTNLCSIRSTTRQNCYFHSYDRLGSWTTLSPCHHHRLDVDKTTLAHHYLSSGAPYQVVQVPLL